MFKTAALGGVWEVAVEAFGSIFQALDEALHQLRMEASYT